MRRLLIKFPSQIRISGWDFGSSARAMNQAGGKYELMTYESVSFAQADLVKVTRSTTERKSMSTKTSTIKRIALVAVAALGLGFVSGVTANAGNVSTGTLSTNGSSSTVSAAGSKSFTVTVTGTKTNGSSNPVVVRLSATSAGANVITASAGAASNSSVSFSASAGAVETATVQAINNATSFSSTFNVSMTYAVTTVFTASVVSGIDTLPSDVTFTTTVAAGTTNAAPGTGESPLTTQTGSTHLAYVTGVNLVASPYAPAYSTLTQKAGTGNFINLKWNAATTGGVYKATLSAGGSWYSASSAYATCSNPLATARGASVTLSGSTVTIGSGSTSGDAVGAANGITTITCTGGVYDSGDLDLKIATPTVGSYTLLVTSETSSGGVATSVPVQVITIIVTPDIVTTDYASSTATISAQTGGWKAGGGAVYAPKTSGTYAADLTINQYLADGVTNVSSVKSKAVTVTLTGVGSLAPISNGASSQFVAFAAGAGATQVVPVYADGRAGTASIAVTVNGELVKTRTVKFYGDVASVSATQIYSIGQALGGTTGALSATTSLITYQSDLTAAALATDLTTAPTGGSKLARKANDPAIAVVVKDALGTEIPTLPSSLVMASSNISVVRPVISADAFLDSGKGAYAVGDALIHLDFTTATTAKSGDKATVTYSVLNTTTGTFVTSAPITITVGGVVAKEVLSLDSATYEPGAPMVLTITATDAAGNPVYDGATGPALTANKSLGGALPSEGTYVGGKIANLANKLFAPVSEGDFTILGTGTDAGATKLSLTASVSGLAQSAIDAANEATDAANAATDAANAAAEAADAATAAAQDAQAAVAALATQVAKLIAALKAQITTLTNLVIKIQKKVRA